MERNRISYVCWAATPDDSYPAAAAHVIVCEFVTRFGWEKPTNFGSGYGHPTEGIGPFSNVVDAYASIESQLAGCSS